MARIVYCDDSEPGITRRKVRHGWGYWDAEGKRITDRAEIDRLNAIGLPPAYTDAWFSPKANGHIQAVGWDDKGRKQYRYHPDFREAREAEKYELCAEFGSRLPRLRKHVAADLRHRKMDKARAVAAVVRLLDLGFVRVGSECYVKSNKSFGATTLRMRHADIDGRVLRLQFKAKSGKMQTMAIADGSLIRFVRTCQDLPGQHLFQWLDGEGETHPVSSTDVNDYIHDAMGEAFTAKHFRTWGASVLAFEALATAKRDISLKTMLEPVTTALGNTPAIARQSYVHPRLIELAKNGQAAFREALSLPRKTKYLSRMERGLIAFLEAEAASAPLSATVKRNG